MSDRNRNCLAIVLAAGNGWRMRSPLRSKALRDLGGLPTLAHTVIAAVGAGASDLAVVANDFVLDDVSKVVKQIFRQASFHLQEEQRGTAHAVLAAMPAIKNASEDVLVLFCDTPLVTDATLMRLRKALADGADLAVLGFEARNPTGYGRLMMEGDKVLKIIEEGDASEEECRIKLCNSGVMAFNSMHMLSLLEAVKDENAQREYQLSDVVSIACERGLRVTTVIAPEEESMGINTPVQLAACEAAYQNRCRKSAMELGAELIAPETVFFSYDTVLSSGVVVEPNVVFGTGVVVAPEVRIRAFSYIEGAAIAKGATIGPYARIRRVTNIGEMSQIGNFVEVKNSHIGIGTKIKHLAYIGDARIGNGVNIGASSVVCNYDGVEKHITEVQDDAFIGAGSLLIAPVTVGTRAYVAAGSVITDDVPGDSLAVARSRQINKEDWRE